MKYSKPFLLIAIFLILIQYNLFGQNPNWSMPPNRFQPDVQNYSNLPQPSTSIAYSGAPATHMHAAYSDPNGDVLVFTVDEKVYDKNGHLVNDMYIDGHNKKGYNERLILPFGRDCSRFAIIYVASSETNELYYSKLFGRRLYMAEYDMDQSDLGSIGALKYDNANSTLIDISKRDAMLYGAPAGSPNDIYFFDEYGHQEFRTNIQIAATELIDNCFYYVFVSDGKYLMRYKLSQNGFDFDNYVYSIPDGSHDVDFRSEMELIKLSNGNYRIAIPKLNPTGNHVGIEVLDVSGSTGIVMTGSSQVIPLSNSSGVDADPYGIEFGPSGNYVYITHKSIPGLTNALDVYDLNTSSFVSIPTLTGIGSFRKSYIERYGDKMYLASDNYIGQLINISNPINLSFNASFIAITPGYGSGLGGGPSSTFFRYLLPDQVDMPYPVLADMSCSCCKRWHADKETFTATESETWSPGANNNPFGSVNGSVYIRDELRIKAGTKIDIQDMNFYFGPDAVVVVERGDGTHSGAQLNLNNTVFTADLSCSDAPVVSCGVTDPPCEKERWEGVRVEGDATDHTQSGSKQALFTMVNNSMIEFAKTGIRAGHKTLADYGGGIVDIKNSRIKDNITGIHFDPFVRLSGSTEQYNYSKVALTTFTTTSDWFGSAFPNTFVDIDLSSGIYLNGNTYANTDPSSFSLSHLGNGITTKDSRVQVSWYCTSTMYPCPPQNVVRSEFTDLYYGIHGLNSPKYTRTFYCHYNIFNNNYYGVFLSKFINPEILDNDFNLQYEKGSVGLYLLSSTGYYVQNNNFETYNAHAFAKNIGLLIEDSGPADNWVYRNYFTNLSYAGYASDQNVKPSNHDYGLHWICNTFDKDIIMADIYLDGGMSDDQGLCSSQPAGNHFSHSSQQGGIYAGHMGLNASASSTVNIIYSHHIASLPSSLLPVAYDISHYQLAQCGVPYTSKSCPQDLTGAPPGKTKNIYKGKSNGDDPQTYASVNSQAGEFAAQIASLEGQLDGGHTDELLELINNGGSAEEISALLTAANGNISSVVLQAIANNENLNLIQLASTNLNDVSDIESELKYVKHLNNKFWNGIVSQYMADTTGAISKTELQELISTYTPSNIQRFASIIMPEGSQDWIDTQNLSNTQAPSVEALPVLIGDSLPADIPEWFEGDFFASANNTGALNSLYIANDAIYNPYINGVEWPDFTGVQKSMEGNSKETHSSKLVVQPNPFSTTVQFDLRAYSIKGEGNRIELYDLLGKRIFTQQLKENQTDAIIFGTGLPEGVMLYKLILNDKPVENGKIIRLK